VVVGKHVGAVLARHVDQREPAAYETKRVGRRGGKVSRAVAERLLPRPSPFLRRERAENEMLVRQDGARPASPLLCFLRLLPSPVTRMPVDVIGHMVD
jgi:hypothetical protein